MPEGVYRHEDFERIANALGIEIAAVARHKKEFEAAAFEFRSWRKVFEKRTPTELSRKLKKIQKAAHKLLQLLGVDDPSFAADGPGDREIFDVLTMTQGSDDIVANATGRIGRLAEILDSIRGVEHLRRLVEQAALERAELARITTTPGNPGNMPLNEWIAAMMGLYRKMTGNDPATSVGAPGRKNEAKPGGPLIRFLCAAAMPLKGLRSDRLQLSGAALRRRVRTLLAHSRAQN
jgi:hypothetical protein